MKKDDVIFVTFEGDIALTKQDIIDGNGDFTQAVQNLIGSSGACAENAHDENDCYTLAQHEGDFS